MIAERLKTLFRTLRKRKRCGLIAYITVGDPDVDTTIAIVDALLAAGADAIELGVPFSDPIADGPVIQAAAQRALAGGATPADALKVARSVRSRSEAPLIIFSYLNPILRYGTDAFARDAAAAGVDAVLVTDLPPESSRELRSSMHSHGLGVVFLLAPTSSDARLAAIDRASDAFVYYVSTTGVTGTRTDLDPDLVDRLDQIRARVKKPLAVGFGVSRPEHYAALRDHCEAVVVGSAIVRAIGSGTAAGAAQRAADVVRTIIRS